MLQLQYMLPLIIEAGNQRILAAEQDLSIGNVVFMGMGEPLLNLDNVLKSIRLLNDPQGQQIGIRTLELRCVGHRIDRNDIQVTVQTLQ